MATLSHWKKVRLPRFGALRKSIKVDVLVIGGGLTGITAAYLLKKSGKKVALIDRDRCAQIDTGNTTAHLTCVTDLRLHELVKRFTRDHAQAVWDAGTAAIDKIEQIVATEEIECEFVRVPGFLHASLDDDKNETKALKRDAELATELGFPARIVSQVPLFRRPGIRFANQAKFHPLMYLAQLVERVPGKGSHVFERTEATKFERNLKTGPVRVTANNQTIRCKYVVIATDVPLQGLSETADAASLQAKLAPYTSYVVGAALAKDTAPVASFWDTSNPYYYLRVDDQPRRQYAIFGGLDHKTGQVDDTKTVFDRLEKKLFEFLPEAKIDRRWSGQVIESHDGLPLIGESTDRQYIATGYSGNGITFGTLAGMMICDAIDKRKNPWRELFDPHRKQLRGGVWNYITENLEYPYYFVKDRLARAEGKSLQSLKRGQGKILKINGERVAAYRDDNGKATVLSPFCTHMGCIVHWNDAERSWDCPCHGSRFEPTGNVIAGPAEKPLDPAEKAQSAVRHSNAARRNGAAKRGRQKKKARATKKARV